MEEAISLPVEHNKLYGKIMDLNRKLSKSVNFLSHFDIQSVLMPCLTSEMPMILQLMCLNFCRILASSPCITMEQWGVILAYISTNLSSGCAAPLAIQSLRTYSYIPLPGLLQFFVSSENSDRNMRTLTDCLTHEQPDIQVCAIETMSSMSIRLIISLFTPGTSKLSMLLYSSDEHRIQCEQDIWTAIEDIWKGIINCCENDNDHVSGTAFCSLYHLYSGIYNLGDLEICTDSAPVNSLKSVIYFVSSPRYFTFKNRGQCLPPKYQVYAINWISFLLHEMMEKMCNTASSIGDKNFMDIDEPYSGSRIEVLPKQLSTDIVVSWFIPFIRNSILEFSHIASFGVHRIASHKAHLCHRLEWSIVIVESMVSYYNNENPLDIDFCEGLKLVEAMKWAAFEPFLAYTQDALRVINRIVNLSDRHVVIGQLLKNLIYRCLQNKLPTVFDEFCKLESVVTCWEDTSKVMVNHDGFQTIFCLFEQLNLYTSSKRILCVQGLFSINNIVLSRFEECILSPNEDLLEFIFLYLNLVVTTCNQFLVYGSRDEDQVNLLNFLSKLKLKFLPLIPQSKVRFQIVWILVNHYEPLTKDESINDLIVLCEKNMLIDHQQERIDILLSKRCYDGNIYGGAVTIKDPCMYCESQNLDRIEVSLLSFQVLLMRFPDLKSKILSIVHTFCSQSRLSNILSELINDETKTIFEKGSQIPKNRCLLFDMNMIFPVNKLSITTTSPIDEMLYKLNCTAELEYVAVSGSSDPVAVSVNHTVERGLLIDNAVNLTVRIRCCNLTDISLSNFSIQVNCLGFLDLINSGDKNLLNDIKDIFPPGASFVREKYYVVNQFSKAFFFIQLTFHDEDELGCFDKAIACNKYSTSLESLLLYQEKQLSLKVFQRQWNQPHSSITIPINCTKKFCECESAAFLNYIYQYSNEKFHFIQRGSVVADELFMVPIMTMTIWNESILMVLSCHRNASFNIGWKGTLQVKSSGKILSVILENICEWLYIVSCSSLEKSKG